MRTNESALEVSAIENGTVIDHIPSNRLTHVTKILGLMKMEYRITIGTNLNSKKIGKKAIIKISDYLVPEKEIEKIIPFAPKAHVSYIEEHKVIKKMILEMPDEVVDTVKCANPVCVTNLENLSTRFKVINKDDIALECCYCEKITNQTQMKVRER